MSEQRDPRIMALIVELADSAHSAPSYEDLEEMLDGGSGARSADHTAWSEPDQRDPIRADIEPRAISTGYSDERTRRTWLPYGIVAAAAVILAVVAVALFNGDEESSDLDVIGRPADVDSPGQPELVAPEPTDSGTPSQPEQPPAGSTDDVYRPAMVRSHDRRVELIHRDGSREVILESDSDLGPAFLAPDGSILVTEYEPTSEAASSSSRRAAVVRYPPDGGREVLADRGSLILVAMVAGEPSVFFSLSPLYDTNDDGVWDDIGATGDLMLENLTTGDRSVFIEDAFGIEWGTTVGGWVGDLGVIGGGNEEGSGIFLHSLDGTGLEGLASPNDGRYGNYQGGPNFSCPSTGAYPAFPGPATMSPDGTELVWIHNPVTYRIGSASVPAGETEIHSLDVRTGMDSVIATGVDGNSLYHAGTELLVNQWEFDANGGRIAKQPLIVDLQLDPPTVSQLEEAGLYTYALTAETLPTVPMPTTEPDQTTCTTPRPVANDTRLTIYGLGESIRPGMTESQLEAATGHEVSHPYPDLEPMCYFVELSDVDAQLQMDGEFSEGTVGAVWVRTPTYQTPSGLQVGSTMDEVLAALGSQVEVSAHEYTKGGFYLDFVPRTPDDSHLGMRFEVADGLVVSIAAGLQGSTRLIEGCA